MKPAVVPVFSPRYAGQSAVVTGGGSGIGRSIALRLGAEGARVVILDLNPEQAAATAQAVRLAGGQGLAIPCDVADTDSVRRAIANVGRIDVLVNSAGIAHVGTIEGTAADDMDRVYRVNVKGTYHSMHFAVPLMTRQGGGVILNLASIASKIGIADRFAYSMSKGAVLAMTLSVARDYLAQKIRCNCVCPARIHTPFVDGFIAKNYPDRKDEKFRELSAYQPIGRMGTPDEVAALVAFLCSSEAGFITGAAYDIDGGVISLR